MAGRDSTGHITRKSSCSAIVPRHLLLVAEGRAQKDRVLWLILDSYKMPCLPRGQSGLCLPGTEVEDGDGERESEGTGK